jgi:protein-tyrosine-phosphatase
MLCVLFVCTANVCRSPMASALYQKLVADVDESGEWQIESAGTLAVPGIPAAVNARLAMKKLGLNIENHRSQPVSAQMLENFDLILTMEQGHKESLSIEFPQISGRTYLLSEMVGATYEIWDPVGGSLDDFTATANELFDILTRGFNNLKRLALAGSGNKV